MIESEPESIFGEYSVEGSFPYEIVPHMKDVAREMGFILDRIVGPGGHYIKEPFIPAFIPGRLVIGKVGDGYERIKVTTPPGKGMLDYWERVHKLIPQMEGFLESLGLKTFGHIK